MIKRKKHGLALYKSKNFGDVSELKQLLQKLKWNTVKFQTPCNVINQRRTSCV